MLYWKWRSHRCLDGEAPDTIDVARCCRDMLIVVGLSHNTAQVGSFPSAVGAHPLQPALSLTLNAQGFCHNPCNT